MSTIQRLTAADIARQSEQPSTLLEDLRYFTELQKRREDRSRFFRELGWWALVIGAVVLAVYSILRGGR